MNHLVSWLFWFVFTDLGHYWSYGLGNLNILLFIYRAMSLRVMITSIVLQGYRLIMTQLCHTNCFIESVRPRELCTDLEVLNVWLQIIWENLQICSTLHNIQNKYVKVQCLLKVFCVCLRSTDSTQVKIDTLISCCYINDMPVINVLWFF